MEERKDFVMCAQRSPEWYALKVGRVTGSRVSKMLDTLKGGGEGAKRKSLKMELLAERLAGKLADNYVDRNMQWGIDHEDEARIEYQNETFQVVTEIGFAYHPTILWAGASPDGLVGDKGLVEIKCPMTTTHLGYILSGEIPPEYLDQMQWQMRCTGREWCDFASFDPRIEGRARLFIKRVEANHGRQAFLDEQCECLLREVDELERCVLSRCA